MMLQSVCLHAQTGTLTGKVTDESGAVVPKAKVVLAGPTGSVRAATSSDDGSYSFAGLTPGDYSIQASAPDLAMAEAVKIAVRTGPQVLNVQLKVAATMQQVTVRENVG